MAHHLQDGRRSRVSGRRLCRADEIQEGSGRGFRLGSGPDLRMVLVVRRGGTLHAYENACPHMGTPLNFLADRFFDRNREHLLCATHGALFRIADGFCLAGPCAGKSLKRAAIRVAGDDIVLADDAG
jgi:nitrite reductase/ring-hydroxylating ferredoxin subunit